MSESHQFGDYDDEEEMDCEPRTKDQPPLFKRPRQKGLLDKFVTFTPPDILNGRKEEHLKGPSRMGKNALRIYYSSRFHSFTSRRTI